jgi:hypothetical protein
MNWFEDRKILAGRLPDDLTVEVFECPLCECRNYQVLALGDEHQLHLCCWRCDQVYCMHTNECVATAGDLNPARTDAVFNPPF